MGECLRVSVQVERVDRVDYHARNGGLNPIRSQASAVDLRLCVLVAIPDPMRAIASSLQNLRQSTLSINILVSEEDYLIDYETPIFTYHDGCDFPRPRFLRGNSLRKSYIHSDGVVLL